MKKCISIFLLSTFFVPFVTFASWYNPFTWKIFQKKEIVTQDQSEIQKTPEEKINELQEQLNELKKQQKNPALFITENKSNLEIKKVVPKVADTTQSVDLCLNINGIQTKIPEGYSWSYGNICSVISSMDYCPNINGIQSKIPDGMFIYGDDKLCLTKNEINYIAEKMTELKNNEIASNMKNSDPVESKECEDAQEEYDSLYEKMNRIKDISERADFAIYEVNPAQRRVSAACRLNIQLEKIEPKKSANCYVNYYSSTASITCYHN